MRRKPWRRGGYRGRFAAQRATRRLMLVLSGVLVLILTVLGMGQRWVVYTDQGVQLQLPFLSSSAPDRSKVDVSVQVQASAPVPMPTSQTLTRTRAVWTTVEELERNGLEPLEAAGVNAVVLDMKTPDGRLGYISYQSLAGAGNGTDDGVIPLLAQLRSEDVWTVACVSCFRDDRLGDETGWLTPGDEAVEQYLSGVVAELARMGFDEILLEHWRSPRGEEEQTLAFLARAEQELAESGAVLSVLGDDAAPERLSGRLWSTQGDAGSVRLVTAFDPEGHPHQAIKENNG